MDGYNRLNVIEKNYKSDNTLTYSHVD